MTLNQLIILTVIQTALSGLVAIVAWVNYKSRPYFIRLIGLLFFIGFVSNSLSLILFFNGINRVNIPQSIYTILSFVLITMIYYNMLDRRYKLWFILFSVTYVVFFILNIFFIQKFEINSYSKSLGSAIIIFYAILYFYRLMVDLPASHLHRMPFFWINSAFLFFMTGTIILHVFTSYIVHVLENDFLSYRAFHNVVSIIQHLIIFIGLYFDLRQKDSSPVLQSNLRNK